MAGIPAYPRPTLPLGDNVRLIGAQGNRTVAIALSDLPQATGGGSDPAPAVPAKLEFGWIIDFALDDGERIYLAPSPLALSVIGNTYSRNQANPVGQQVVLTLGYGPVGAETQIGTLTISADAVTGTVNLTTTSIPAGRSLWIQGPGTKVSGLTRFGLTLACTAAA